MTLVFHESRPTPGTHAIIIGVGAYAPNEWGLEDLPSPICSARAFAEWLLREFRNPDAPLASLDILLSDPRGSSICPDASGNPVAVERAKIAEVKAAIRAWEARCHENRDNLAIFYFCGHGFAKGMNTSLLLDGFGTNRFNIMEDAIDFDGLLLGMDRCDATRQLYIIDACRNTPPQALVIPNSMGDEIIGAELTTADVAFARNYPVIYATGTNQRAYGTDNQPSSFTSAFLDALHGAAWDDLDDPWVSWTVNVERLGRVISDVLALRCHANLVPPQQAFLGGNVSGFRFHQPPPRHAPCRAGARWVHA